MWLVKFLLLCQIVGIAIYSFRKNHDVFSPAKVYLAYSTYFYLAIFFEEVQWETLLTYFLLIQSVTAAAYFEKARPAPYAVAKERNATRLYVVIWVLSLPGFITMYSFVAEAGGIVEHLLSLGRRVEAWRGQGHLIVFLNTLPTLTLLYFAKLVSDPHRSRVAIAIYVAHFLAFVLVGLLTASRSFIALPILGAYVMWTYLKRPPRMRYVLVLVAFLSLFVSVLGALRNSNYGGEEGISLFDEDTGRSTLESTQLAYGVMPLEIIFKSPEKEILWGSTYLTLFTNFVPRSIWPEKPDTAGLLFTKLYTDDQSGLSFYATGAVTEAVMNFGQPGGLMFGSLMNLFALVAGCVLYNRIFQLKRRERNEQSLISLIIYFYVVVSFARVSYGEFTDIFQSLFFFDIAPLLAVRILYSLGPAEMPSPAHFDPQTSC